MWSYIDKKEQEYLELMIASIQAHSLNANNIGQNPEELADKIKALAEMAEALVESGKLTPNNQQMQQLAASRAVAEEMLERLY